MATLAPEGTEWHGLLVELGQEWKKVTDGEVRLRICLLYTSPSPRDRG